MKHDLTSFDAFWRQYVREHASERTRRLHFVGTSLALACLAGAVLTRHRWLVLLAPIASGGANSVSHALEGARGGVCSRHKWWNLRADLVMWARTVAGTMDGEVERVLRSNSPASVTDTPAPEAAPPRPSAPRTNGSRAAWAVWE